MKSLEGKSRSGMDFIILKVNGQDLTRASHEDAVRAFQLADEPIVVEVLRRGDDGAVKASSGTNDATNARAGDATVNGNCSNGASSPCLVSTAVQTDWSASTLGLWADSVNGDAASILLGSGSIPVPVVFPTDNDNDNDDSFEDFLGPEIDCEEVTLQRNSSREKLGLTLCYSSEAEDADTEVYISAISPDSVAGRDGRLREGDQIVQVNGIDITSKRQAEALFAECKEAVTLLVTRPQFQEETELLEDLECVCDGESSAFMQIPELEEGTGAELASNPSHQDSGVGQESVRNEEFSDHETNDQEAPPLHTTVHSAPARSKSKEAPSESSNSHQSVPVHHPTSSSTPSTPAFHQNSPPIVQEPRSVIPRSVSHSPLRERAPDPWWSSRTEGHNNTESNRRNNSEDKEVQALKRRVEHLQLEGKASPRRNGGWPVPDVVEHIYETIPENTESDEPIYCVPYEPTSTKKGKSGRRTEDVALWVRNGGVGSSTVTTESWLKKPELNGHESWQRTASTSTSSSNSSENKPNQVVGEGGNNKRSSTRGSSSGEDQKDSSSAYNTGESCRSTPLTLELGPAAEQTRESTLVLCSPPTIPPPPPVGRCCQSPQSTPTTTEDRSLQVNLDSDTYSVISCESCRRCMRLPQAPPSPKKTRTQQPPTSFIPLAPSDTMYTNAANLQQTIWLQQQLFRQAMKHQPPAPKKSPSTEQHQTKKPAGTPALYVPPFARNAGYFAPSLSRYQFVSSPYTGCGTMPAPIPEDCEEIGMEWKVKKRPDGSRYITRRPVRNKLLKDRAQKIQEERSGLTTDDDAMSELKIGRYWSKEERKRHLEVARERRRRQEALLRAKESGVNVIGHGGTLPVAATQHIPDIEMAYRSEDRSKRRNINIVELSHKKMARKNKGAKEGFDDFTTVQEMLVHGNKMAPGAKMMGLLSVTTV